MAKAAEVADTNFEQSVLKNPTPTLVDFWAPWCGPCRMVSPIVEELADDYQGRLNVVKMNTDENYQTPGRYGIMAIPTLILFKDGQEAARIQGFRPKAEMKRLVDAALSQS